MAHFHRERFMDTPEECAWLRAVHLQDAPPFASFTIAGTDDSPARLDLFKEIRPAYNVQPMAVFERDPTTGKLALKQETT